MEHHPNTDTVMEVAPLSSSMVEFEDATGIEYGLRNASLGDCKDAHPAMHSSNDDEDEGNQEHQGDALMSNHVILSGVGYVGALHESNSNPTHYSKQGNKELHVENKGHMTVDLLAHKVDPYEDAICNDPNGGCDAFFPSRPHSYGFDILHEKICIFFTCLFNFRLV